MNTSVTSRVPDVGRVPEAGRLGAEKGIFAPKPELLNVGDYIYRFASDVDGFGNVKSLGLHAGNWWIRQRDFELILNRAFQTGVNLGQAARWDLAVLPKWGSRMNVVIEARISQRLWAWTGPAKLQMETSPNGKVIRLLGCSQIRQLYLHDIVDQSGMLTPLGRGTLGISGAKVIESVGLY